jgi:hypothetical protein
LATRKVMFTVTESAKQVTRVFQGVEGLIIKTSPGLGTAPDQMLASSLTVYKNTKPLVALLYYDCMFRGKKLSV